MSSSGSVRPVKFAQVMPEHRRRPVIDGKPRQGVAHVGPDSLGQAWRFEARPF